MAMEAEEMAKMMKDIDTSKASSCSNGKHMNREVINVTIRSSTFWLNLSCLLSGLLWLLDLWLAA